MTASLPVSILDLVVIGVIVISALLAAVRGFTREVLAIVAWVTAAGAAWMLHPLVLTKVKEHVSNPQIALAIAIGGVFIVVLLIVSLITVKLSDFILDSRIGALDRTLGFLFGAARGFLICVIGWAGLTWLAGEKIPEWAQTARLRPALAQSSATLLSMLPDPDGILAQIKKQQTKPDGTETPSTPSPATPGGGRG